MEELIGIVQSCVVRNRQRATSVLNVFSLINAIILFIVIQGYLEFVLIQIPMIFIVGVWFLFMCYKTNCLQECIACLYRLQNNELLAELEVSEKKVIAIGIVIGSLLVVGEKGLAMQITQRMQ